MRLKGRDYSLADLYFVTICATQRRCILSTIVNRNVELTALGHIVRESWFAIPTHFARVQLHSFVVMPNHVHGIIGLGANDSVQHTAPVHESRGVPAGSLSAIVRSFKSEVTARGRRELQWQGRIWQPNYYDRVLRNSREFADATEYIVTNPMKWQLDFENASVANKNGLAQHAARLQRTRLVGPA